MKIIYLTFILLSTVLFRTAQNDYSVSGSVPEKYNGSYVFIAPVDINLPFSVLPAFTDSAVVENGTFTFNGKTTDNNLLHTIHLNRTISSFIALDTIGLKADYVENNPIGYFKVSGTKLNEQLTGFVEHPLKMAALAIDMMKERQELMAKKEWTLEKQKEQEEPLKASGLRYVELASQLIKDNIDNSVGQYILVMMGGNINKDVFAEIESKLSSSVKQRMEENRNLMTKMLTNNLTDSVPEQVKVGKQYVDFKGKLPSGKKVNLSELIKSKKLILLDFWASWCVPCIKAMPDIANLYVQYKDRGFEIVGISIDNDREQWKNRIQKTGITWPQLIDYDLSNPIKDMYGVRAIPHIILIDENGVIIAHKLQGEALKKEVSEAFD
jgi:peroxiredoxin